MPVSMDPQPAEDEIECGNCGAYIHLELTRCPNCGVNLYEPGQVPEREDRLKTHQEGFFSRLEGFLRQITKRPYPVDELFGAALNQAALYNNLLNKVSGDHAAVERLVEYESRQAPGGTRLAWLKSAIRRWEQDNRSHPGE
jgi:hypothetical protein